MQAQTQILAEPPATIDGSSLASDQAYVPAEQPSPRSKTHGFRLRMRTRAGRAILAARRRKGRDRLAA